MAVCLDITLYLMTLVCIIFLAVP